MTLSHPCFTNRCLTVTRQREAMGRMVERMRGLGGFRALRGLTGMIERTGVDNRGRTVG